MKIKYLGHSSFLLSNGAGTSVICDPFDPSVGFAMPAVTADIVTLSHHHYDHDYVQAIGGFPAVYDGGERVQSGGVEISAVKSWHDERCGALRGANLIYKFVIDGITLCHMGDIGEPCSDRLIKEIGRVDVLMIPVGGTYTVDAAGAKAYVDALAPEIVIPMHYRTKGCTLDISGADKFLALFDGACIEHADEEIELTRDCLDCGRMRIIVLKRSEK